MWHLARVLTACLDHRRHCWAPPPWTQDSVPHPVLTRLGDGDWPACDGTIYDREKGECAPVLYSSVVTFIT